MIKFLKKIQNKLKKKNTEIRNKILGKRRRLKLTHPDFTIISNNCWGGKVYQYFNIQYNSPTVGLFIMPKDFIKLCSDLKMYINSELSFIDLNESKYKEFLLEKLEQGVFKKNNNNVIIGKINDIEIVFLHYKTREEAYEKWNRRKKRINWNNLIFKINNNNMFSEEDYMNWCKINLNGKKVLITNQKCYDNTIYIEHKLLFDDTVDDTSYFEDVNIIELLNNLYKK